jgi:class 3 adenylate cyclase
LLFSDIEGSTRLLDRLGGRYEDLLKEHHRVLREAIAASGGREVDTAGDSFFVVFEGAADAVECARRAQLGLARGEWPGRERRGFGWGFTQGRRR